MSRQLTESQVHSLQEHPAWIEIVKQLEIEKNSHHLKVIGELDPRSAGAYQMIELVLGFPQRFIEEIRKEENGNRSVLNFSRLGPKKG